MSHYPNLQKPIYLGDLKLKNRVIMASLTRNRGLIPSEINIEYYIQRSGAGLILTEGILIEPQGGECLSAPGIWNKQQIDGFKKLTGAVHDKGGLIFAQLWHLGRAAHTLHNQGIPPPAPSNIPAKAGKFRLLKGEPGYSIPQAIEDPKHYVQLFKKAAENAKLAGFDGVELHSANGYLPNQFLESHSNNRNDQYGGSVENRSRFVLETIDALKEIYPSKQIGIKLSPSGGYNDMGDGSKDKILEQYSHLIKELDSRDIGYIQLVRYFPETDPAGRGTQVDIQEFHPLIKNALFFANLGFTGEEGDKYVADGKADAITYGRPYIINPDLHSRLFSGTALNEQYDFTTFYNSPEDQPGLGYTSYPAAQC